MLYMSVINLSFIICHLLLLVIGLAMFSDEQIHQPC